jgi:hypothetical protein
MKPTARAYRATRDMKRMKEVMNCADSQVRRVAVLELEHDSD